MNKKSVSSNSEEEFLENDSGETFSCKYCQYETYDIEELDEHIINHEEALLEDSVKTEPSPSKPSLATIGSHPEAFLKAVDGHKKFRASYLHNYGYTQANILMACPYCSYQSNKSADMQEHLKGHADFIYSCSECSFKTQWRNYITEHLLRHCGGSPFKCDKCSFQSWRKSHLNRHIAKYCKGKVRELPCKKCSFTAPNKKELMRHYNLHPVEYTFHCPHCTYKTSRNDYFKKHTLSHGAEALYMCSICSFGTDKRALLLKHLRTHQQECYDCTECGYSVATLSGLHRHALLHRDPSVSDHYKCQKCDYQTTLSKSFSKHVLSLCKENGEVAMTKIEISENSIFSQLDGADANAYGDMQTLTLGSSVEVTQSY